MKRIILSLLFMCCALNAYGVAIITPESLFCRVSGAIPNNCDSIRTDGSCNALCPLRDYGDMTLGVNRVCEEDYYRNCVKYCNVSCKYRCPDDMYGTVTAINAGDSIQINGVNCTVCPTGDGVLSCGGALSVFSESGTTITATSKLICKIGYTESNGKCVADSSTVQCPDGQYLHTYNGATACATCPANATCVNNELTCNTGYSKYIGQQSPYSMYFCCLNNATCNDTGNFSHCNTGYYGDATNGCTKCPANATCNGGATFTCKSGYTKQSSFCCLNNATCDDTGNFSRCNDGYYGDATNGCKTCPANATCNGGTTFTCKSGYFKYTNGTETGCEPCGISRFCQGEKCLYCKSGYYGECAKGCTKCPSLDGHAGTSDTPNNIGRESCYVKGTLEDDIGMYFFIDNNGICNAEKEESEQQTE